MLAFLVGTGMILAGMALFTLGSALYQPDR